MDRYMGGAYMIFHGSYVQEAVYVLATTIPPLYATPTWTVTNNWFLQAQW